MPKLLAEKINTNFQRIIMLVKRFGGVGLRQIDRGRVGKINREEDLVTQN